MPSPPHCCALLALRSCKRNGGHGQTTLLVNGACEDDGDTSSSQIAMAPTSLAVFNATMRL